MLSGWVPLTLSRLQSISVSHKRVAVPGAIFHAMLEVRVIGLISFITSSRCPPSLGLSYFCCLPRGMSSPSININVVISAGRPRVTSRKMSWNRFLTFISQSGWALFLARRVFTHPTHETILKLKGYLVSGQGLAQVLLGLGSIRRQKAGCKVNYFLWSFEFLPPMGAFEWLSDGDELQVLTYAWRWETYVCPGCPSMLVTPY